MTQVNIYRLYISKYAPLMPDDSGFYANSVSSPLAATCMTNHTVAKDTREDPMPRFDAAQFIEGSARCELTSNLFALPPQLLPRGIFSYEVSLPQHPDDSEMLKELLEDFVGQYIPAQSAIMLGDACMMLDQPIGAIITHLLQRGAEGLTWNGLDGGVEAGTIGIAAADEEGNDQTLLLNFRPVAVGLQDHVHGFYNGQQPDRTYVSPYCDLVCQIYSYLLNSSDRFQQFQNMIVDKNSRASIPFMAAYAGFSLTVRPYQAGLGLTLVNKSLGISGKHSLIDFAFHHLSRVFGSKEAMMNLCQRNCRDAGYDRFQALRRRLRGNVVTFSNALLRSQPPSAASMQFEIADLLCVSGNFACASPELFVRFQRFGLNIPEPQQLSHLPLACLKHRTPAVETVVEQIVSAGYGDFDDSDSSEDEQPKSKRRKQKNKTAAPQNQATSSDTVHAPTHDVLEMKTDDIAQEMLVRSLDQFDLLVPMEWLEVVAGYLLPNSFQSAARDRFVDAKFRQIQGVSTAIGQACAANPVLGIQTSQLSSPNLRGYQLAPLAVRYRSPAAADFQQYLDQPITNGLWDLVHPMKHFAYRPHVDAWVVLSFCNLGTGKSSYGVSAAQIEYFLDALCETMEGFGMEVANLQSTKPIFFPNPNQSTFDAMKTIVHRFKLQDMDNSIMIVVHPPAMDEYERAEVQWLAMCRFGVPLVFVDINTVYENQPKKNKTERLLGMLAAEINLKSKGQNFKLGYQSHGLPGVLPDESDDIVASEPPEMLSLLFREVQPYICIGISVGRVACQADRYIYTACSSLDRSLARCIYEACVTPHPPPGSDNAGGGEDDKAHCQILAELVRRILMQCKSLTQRLPRLVLLYREADAEFEWRHQHLLMNERQAIEAALRDFLGNEVDVHYMTVSTNHGTELSVAGAWGNPSARTIMAGTLVAHDAVDVRAQQFYLCSHKPETSDETTVPRYTVIPDRGGTQTQVPLEVLQTATYFLCHMHQARGKVGILPPPLTYARQLYSIIDVYLSERHKDHCGARSARDRVDEGGYAIDLLSAQDPRFIEFHEQARSGKMFLA